DCALDRRRLRNLHWPWAVAVLAALGAGERGTHAPSHGAAVLCAVLACLLPWRPRRLVRPELSDLAAARARIWACILRPRSSRTSGWSPGSPTSVMRPRATPSSSLVAPLRAPICLRFFGGSPAARARSQRLVAPAHRRPELHHFRVCSGFLQASRFCERQVSDGVFAVCASLRGGSGAEGDGVRPARPHIRRQAVALGPFKPLTLPSRVKPPPPDRAIGCA